MSNLSNSEGISPLIRARYTRLPKGEQNQLIAKLQIAPGTELADPYKETLAEAYRHIWNKTIKDMVPRMNLGQLPEALVSQVRADVARTMREVIKSGKDPLTGLPNKESIEKAINRYIKQIHRDTGKSLIGLFIDLDKFKSEVNDKLGHEAGDNVIITIGKILDTAKRDTDIIARISGDEFGVGLFDMTEENVGVFIDRIKKGLEGHSSVPGISAIGISIGACIFTPRDLFEAKELLHHADIAMSHAKGVNDRVKLKFWQPGMEIMERNSSR